MQNILTSLDRLVPPILFLQDSRDEGKAVPLFAKFGAAS
jgi:hypothetical protein